MIAFFICFFLALSINSLTDSAPFFDSHVDYFGHVLGAAGAILYCRLRPICRESFGMVNDR